MIDLHNPLRLPLDHPEVARLLREANGMRNEGAVSLESVTHGIGFAESHMSSWNEGTDEDAIWCIDPAWLEQQDMPADEPVQASRTRVYVRYTGGEWFVEAIERVVVENSITVTDMLAFDDPNPPYESRETQRYYKCLFDCVVDVYWSEDTDGNSMDEDDDGDAEWDIEYLTFRPASRCYMEPGHRPASAAA